MSEVSEQSVHAALMDVVQKIRNEFGIRINSASFDWISTATASEPWSELVLSVRLDSSMQAGWRQSE